MCTFWDFFPPKVEGRSRSRLWWFTNHYGLDHKVPDSYFLRHVHQASIFLEECGDVTWLIEAHPRDRIIVNEESGQKIYKRVKLGRDSRSFSHHESFPHHLRSSGLLDVNCRRLLQRQRPGSLSSLAQDNHGRCFKDDNHYDDTVSYYQLRFFTQRLNGLSKTSSWLRRRLWRRLRRRLRRFTYPLSTFATSSVINL